MLLFPPAHHPTLPPFQRGGDTARYADRLRFPRTADLPTRYAVGERVRIHFHEQRAWLTEPIQFIEITLYPRQTRYRFNFVYNRRRVTLWASEQQLMEWNAPPPPVVATTKKKRKKNVDRFACAWGVCRLDVHPDIPARWAARHIPTGAVIELPAISQSTAHERFVMFMERLEVELPVSEWERSVSIPPLSAKNRPPARRKVVSGHPTATKPKPRKTGRILDYPQLRVRKVAS